jgi:hypothetical protein
MVHVRHPADAERLRPSIQVGVGQLTGAAEQLAVTCPGTGVGHPGLSTGDPLDHLGDQPLLLRLAGASRHQDDDLVAISVRGHRAAATGTSPDLDQRRDIDHAVTLSRSGDNNRRSRTDCGRARPAAAEIAHACTGRRKLSTSCPRGNRRVVPKLSTADYTSVDLGLRVCRVLWTADRHRPADVPASWA